MSDINTNFAEFLTYALKVKEVALVLASDEREQIILQELLTQANFSSVPDVFTLMEKLKVGGKYLIIINSSTSSEDLKKYYDFVAQYATGQIELFDHQASKTVLATPNYGNTSVILLVNKNDLKLFALKGFNFLDNCGLTYHS
jgi:hypothetical protein